MYYVDRLNNGQHPKGRKWLAIGYDLKSVPSNPWALSIVGITRASTLGSLDNTWSIMRK
jgi:hypothetical protein